MEPRCVCGHGMTWHSKVPGKKRSPCWHVTLSGVPCKCRNWHPKERA